MSKNLIIHEGAEDEQSLAELLRHIATQIEGGYTSGHGPGWEIVEDEDE